MDELPRPRAAKPVGGHSAGDVLLAARPHRCKASRTPRGVRWTKGTTDRLAVTWGGLRPGLQNLELPRFGGALIRRPSGYGLALTKARKIDTGRRETP